jgi:hypothetical protein
MVPDGSGHLDQQSKTGTLKEIGDGFCHDQMPEHRASDFDGHAGGTIEVGRNSRVLQPHLLSDLPNSPRMVRQGSLGL